MCLCSPHLENGLWCGVGTCVAPSVHVTPAYPSEDQMRPICPYCNEPVNRFHWRSFGQVTFIFCGACKKILGTQLNPTF